MNQSPPLDCLRAPDMLFYGANMRQHEMSPSALTSGRVARFWLPLEATC